jgi:hypothetical protein
MNFKIVLFVLSLLFAVLSAATVVRDDPLSHRLLKRSPQTSRNGPKKVFRTKEEQHRNDKHPDYDQFLP